MNPHITPNPRCIEILAFADVQLLDVAGPLQVFASANEHAMYEGAWTPPYSVHVVAPTTPVVSSAGLGMTADLLPEPATPIDTLIIAGGRGVHAATQDAELVQWVSIRAKTARRIASVCTGAFLLAEAGLLDARRVVTHWMDCADLAHRYPRLTVETDPIFINDGPIWTSAGVTAGIDLALALVEADIGHAIAMRVARDLVVYLKRPGGQAQFSASLALQQAAGGFEALHRWMEANLAGDLSIPALAKRTGMSERSFVRRYVQASGRTPARSVEMMRVEAAQRLLLDSDLPIKTVAMRCGFGSEETMRRSFGRQIATSPSDFRERFAANRTGCAPPVQN